MSGKVKSAESDPKIKIKERTPKEVKESKEASLSLSGSGGENSAWKRIRPRTVKSSVSSASERSSSSSDLSNAVYSNLLWPEEKTRSEALCIEASRVDWKLRYLTERATSYTEEQKKLVEQRSEQQLKREKLVEQIKHLEVFQQTILHHSIHEEN